MSTKPQKRFAEDKEILPRIDMYNLTINIESEYLDYLKEVIQALTNAFTADDKLYRFSFNHIEERRGGAGRDNHSRGVTAPPPAINWSSEFGLPKFDGLTELQQKAFVELLEARQTRIEVKQQLMEYIGDWEKYKDKRNGDFIDEEEMKL